MPNQISPLSEIMRAIRNLVYVYYSVHCAYFASDSRASTHIFPENGNNQPFFNGEAINSAINQVVNFNSVKRQPSSFGPDSSDSSMSGFASFQSRPSSGAGSYSADKRGEPSDVSLPFGIFGLIYGRICASFGIKIAIISWLGLVVGGVMLVGFGILVESYCWPFSLPEKCRRRRVLGAVVFSVGCIMHLATTFWLARTFAECR